MAYQRRNFFGGETSEDKTRKYTRPYPIVTKHLLNIQQQRNDNFVNTNALSWRSPLNVGFATAYPPPLIIPQQIYHPLPSLLPVNQSLINSQQFPPNNIRQGEMNRKRRHRDTYNDNSESLVKRKRDSLSSYDKGENGKYSKISNEMTDYWEKNYQTDFSLQKKLRLRSALLHVIKRDNPNASLHLVGSSCNGFATNDSDADFCVMLTQQRKIDQKYEACFYLKNIQRSLRRLPSIKKIQFIRAKVPILKFMDNVSGCDCDINVNNLTGIRNTHLLRSYSKVDDRLCPLVLCVKKWAKSRKINDASQGTLSSYNLVMLLIHFLQSGCDPPVFKSLQLAYPDFFRPDSNVNELAMFEPADVMPCNMSANKQSIGELLFGFFEYFATKYSWDTHVVSIRLGSSMPRSGYSEWRDKFICVEEPFDLTNTARAVYNYDKFRLIKFEFKRVGGGKLGDPHEKQRVLCKDVTVKIQAFQLLQKNLSFEDLCNGKAISPKEFLRLDDG